MSSTITGSSTLTVNLASPLYVSPTTITGTINAANNAIDIATPWTINVTGTLNSRLTGVYGTASASIQNSGLIAGQGFAAVYFKNGGAPSAMPAMSMAASRVSNKALAMCKTSPPAPSPAAPPAWPSRQGPRWKMPG
jgi:hypothetical protein